jgi:hypothetical protein
MFGNSEGQEVGRQGIAAATCRRPGGNEQRLAPSQGKSFLPWSSPSPKEGREEKPREMPGAGIGREPCHHHEASSVFVTLVL